MRSNYFSLRRRAIVHGIWAVTALAALGVFVLGLPGLLATSTPSPPAEIPQAWATAVLVINALTSAMTALLSLGLAGMLYWRRPGDRMAVFLSFFMLAYGVIMAGPLEWLQRASPALVPIDPTLVQGLVFVPGFLALVGLFPDGRFVPRWMGWVVLASVALAPLSIYAPCCNLRQARPWLAAGLALASLFLVLGGTYAQIYRYRRVSTPAERQQTKWVLWGLLVLLLMSTISFGPYTFTESLPAGAPLPWWAVASAPFWWLALAVFPLSLAVAVIRYHLWDIDVIIRRTLVYSLLSALLALAYFGSVVVLQAILRPLTGDGRSQVTTVLSTLAIAALFVPVRGGVQRFIDRRFYRRKYDAAGMLAAFAATLRDETDLKRLTDRIVEVVEETMQPAHASLWLAPSQPGRGEARR